MHGHGSTRLLPCLALLVAACLAMAGTARADALPGAVAETAAPATQAAQPVTQAVEPVAAAAQPVTQAAAPVAEAAEPVVQAAARAGRRDG